MRLVADIGGTNSRLALSQAGKIFNPTIVNYSNSKWDDLYAIISHYLSRDGITQPIEMVVAVAGPVHDNRALLTNRNWRVDAGQLKETFGVVSAHILNDLAALGYAVPKLRPDQLQAVSGRASDHLAFSQSLVVGIGTGFNVSPVLERAGMFNCPAVEAGHISMPLAVAVQLQKVGFAQDQFLTIEALFSGRGFTTFCREFTGRPTLEGPATISAYGTPEAADITAAVDHYSMLLGYLLRDLTLAYMPSAGIYLAGSVARSIMATAPRACIDVLRQPYTIQTVNDAPVWMIKDDTAALSGCAEFVFR
jgi:glucokinase